MKNINPMLQVLESKKYKSMFDLLKKIDDFIETTTLKSGDLKDINEIKNSNRGDIANMLLDYIILDSDRVDSLDRDVVNLYDFYLKGNDKLIETFTNYIITLGSLDYVKWFRGIEDFDELVALIDREENPLGVMCVCCRAYFYNVLKGRRDFNSSDFIGLIESCRGKKLSIS